MVGTGAGVAGTAIDHGVGKTGDVTRGFPDLATANDGRVEPHHVSTTGDKKFPPQVFDFLFEFGTERAIIPSVGEPAVDVAPGVEKAATFGKANNVGKSRHESMITWSHGGEQDN